MKRTRLSVAAAGLLAASVVLGSPGAPACQPELHRCLEKLASRMLTQEGAPHWRKVEQALFELHETDPECALLLRGAVLPLY
jgi:hypothetical protein